jgi:hypothetical protein
MKEITGEVLEEYYLGYFGDKRLEQVGAKYFRLQTFKGKVVTNKMSINRAEQIQINRFIQNDKVTVNEILKNTLLKTSENAINVEHILSIQDTSEFNFESHKKKIKDLGEVSNSQIGLFLHPSLAINADDNFVIGLSSLKYWDRAPDRSQISKKRALIEKKESNRWIEVALEAKNTLNRASMITHIGDRENDIYDFLCKIPDEKNHILIRSCQNRNVIDLEGNNTNLNSIFNTVPINFNYEIELPTRIGKRKKQNVLLNVKYKEVKIIKPKVCQNKELPNNILITVVDVKEDNVNISRKSKPMHWRLITTHKVISQKDAINIINFYKKRWNIEQLFRTMKLKGLNVEENQSSQKKFLCKIMVVGLISAIKIMQLVLCRDGKINRKGNASFSEKELDCMEMLLKKYEGKTEKQKNPHKKKTLAWCSWLIARLGGWKGYEKSEGPPGPTTFREGLSQFKAMFEGWSIFLEL